MKIKSYIPRGGEWGMISSGWEKKVRQGKGVHDRKSKRHTLENYRILEWVEGGEPLQGFGNNLEVPNAEEPTITRYKWENGSNGGVGGGGGGGGGYLGKGRGKGPGPTTTLTVSKAPTG